jgi:ribosomal protein S18 acetylase RimI-like enzyme
MNYSYKVIGKTEMDMIKPLWEKLNQIHLHDAHHFQDHFRNFTFAARCNKFQDMDDAHMRIEVALDRDTAVGYCISTIEKGMGEIDSLFIEEKFRKYGLGGQLVENGVKWLKNNNCAKIMVSVAEGHESVFGFYQKHGFYPRMTYLQLKE